MELAALNRKPAAENELNWVTATFMALFHVGAVVALFFFTWKALFVSMFLWWVSKYDYVPMVVVGLVLLVLGGLPFLLWGIFVRTVVGLPSTWMVNSITHTWGSRRFVTHDLSTNNWWVAILTFGEGWHNNHHAHPVSARHGIAWYEVDLNWYGIWALKKLGLARHVYRVKLAQLPPTPVLNTKPDSKLHLVPGTSVSGD